jgi:hypothetical protein
MPLDFVDRVSNIIASACEWPNHLFIPDDQCDVVLLGSDGMDDVEALLLIQDVLGNTIPEKLWAGTYGDTIRAIASISSRASAALSSTPSPEHE